MICKTCGRNIKLYAKGFCKTCYSKQLQPANWSKNYSECVNCKSTQYPHIGRGLCSSCYKARKPSDQLCACGCGEYTSVYRGKTRTYKQGHWVRTAIKTPEWIKMLSDNNSGSNNPCYGLFGKDHPAHGHETTEETRQLRRKMALHRIANRDKSKRTDIEKTVYSWLESFSIFYEEQKIIKDKFTVDFYVPEANLVIEVNGDYWHGFVDNSTKFAEDLSDLQIRNIKRDCAKINYLHACGYSVLTLWEYDIKRYPEANKQGLLDYISMLSSQKDRIL